MLAVWITISYVALYVLLFAFSFTQAKVGQFFGARVERVTIGFTLFTGLGVKWKGSKWEWEFGFFPLGSSTKFWGSNDAEASDSGGETKEPPQEPFYRLSAIQKSLTIGSGPVACLGLTLVLIPVFLGADQLSFASASESTISPVGVNGLKLVENPSTFESQIELSLELFSNIAVKYLLFNRSDGWGGGLSCLVTFGAAGVKSIAAWSTCFGCFAIVLGLIHFIPIPGLSAFGILAHTAESVFGRGRFEKHILNSMLVGILYLLAVYIRLAIADVFWLVDLFT